MSARVICISRAIWVGAEAIAADVAKEFGFPCLDEEIINRAAERRNIAPAEIAGAEQRKSFFAQLVEDVRRGGSSELLNYIPTHRTVPVGNVDVRALIRDAIRDTAKEGNVVIVAHAASYALSRWPGVLRVLVTGSPFVRASRWLTTSGGKSPTEAAETIRDSDKARAMYLKRFYDIDHESPEDYDLTLSTDALPPATITDLIIRAARAIP
jgi:hypothetical protein